MNQDDHPTSLDESFKRLLQVVFEIGGESPEDAVITVATIERMLVAHDGLVSALEEIAASSESGDLVANNYNRQQIARNALAAMKEEK